MLGIGGGIVMAPLMLELGLDPKVAASTSNFLLIFTSSVGTTLFLLAGQLIFDYAVALAIVCTLSSLIGSTYINGYIAKTHRNSLLIYALFYLMVISLIILPIIGIRRAIYDMRSGVDIFEFKNFCR
jgi:uncharacterized membrane protein YfcA